MPFKGLIHHFSVGVFKLIGWRVVTDVELPKRCVMIGAPHTSNLDLVFALLMMGIVQIKFQWVGKAEAFRSPLGGLFRRLGGIPVNRQVSERFVDQVVKWFEGAEKLQLIVAPEGTRKRTQYWKTGFYYMALGAGVPIVLGFIDSRRKEVGWAKLLVPTGNIQEDFELIRQFYVTKRGLRPKKTSEIAIRIM